MTTRPIARRRPVQTTRHVTVPPEVVQALLETSPHSVLGAEELGTPWTDLEACVDLDAGVPGGAHFRRGVRIGWGPLLEDDGALALPLWWEDALHPHLFPTFDGAIEVRRDGPGTALRLVGSYVPPLGALGRFADSLVGHRVVKASLEAFLDAAGQRLVAAAREPVAAGGHRSDSR